MIVTFNIISIIFLILTIVVLAVRHLRKTIPEMRGRMIFFPFVFLILATVTNLIEHAGISDLPDNWEDILGILFFPFLIFTIHASLLKRELRRAEESDRLKSAFLANLSHEIRTPLNGILGFSELLKEGETDPEETRQYATLLKSSSTRFLRVMDNLILLSRIESEPVKLNHTPFETEALLSDIVGEITEPAERKGLRIVVHCDRENPAGTITSDRGALAIILGNLMDNALKFTDQGEITVICRKEGNALKITITDTGCGIHPSEFQRIFTRFGRNEESRLSPVEGMGLGLPIARKLAETLGGRITADSRPGEGSRFTVELPAG